MNHRQSILLFILEVLHIFIANSYNASRSFVIDYDNNQFLKDDKPYRYISGTMHYFRVPHEYWADRLQKFKYLGLDTVQTYIAWNFHEPYKGKYDFEGDHDIFRFFQIAQENGLNVILRPGPYIDAEWDLGGLPYWVLKNKTLVSENTLRSSDIGYLKHVTEWFDYILPKIEPFLYHNGGPIITVQVENEYGSYFARDTKYLISLRDQLRRLLGPDIVLFTTDGNAQSFLKYGKIPEVYATVDFGPNGDVNESFQAQRQTEPSGPLINSEFYTGWIDHWGEPHSRVEPAAVAQTLTQILDSSSGTCVNLYVIEGGTSFAFHNGANYDSANALYLPNPTSYDFDAPLDEGGDPTAKYYAIRDVIGKYRELPHGSIPTHLRQGKVAYGSLTMFQAVDVLDIIADDKYYPTGGLHFNYTPTFEELDHPGGFVLYRHILRSGYNGFRDDDDQPSTLELPDLRDRAHIIYNAVLVGTMGRMDKVFKIQFNASIVPGSTLDILVENQGRICYGSAMNDTKGAGPVFMNGTRIVDWIVFPLDLMKAASILQNTTSSIQELIPNTRLRSGEVSRKGYGFGKIRNEGSCFATFYVGHFKIGKKYGPAPNDTYLNMAQWSKGQVILNGINLGRYWASKGPLQSMYVPGIYIKPYPEKNTLVLFDLTPILPCDSSSMAINFVRDPIYLKHDYMMLAGGNGLFTKIFWISLLENVSKFIKYCIYPFLVIFFP